METLSQSGKMQNQQVSSRTLAGRLLRSWGSVIVVDYRRNAHSERGRRRRYLRWQARVWIVYLCALYNDIVQWLLGGWVL